MLQKALICCVMLLIASSLWASPTPSATAPSDLDFVGNLSQLDRRVFQTSSVEFELLMQRKQRQLTDEIRSQLVFTLERLVASACMSQLSSKLAYAGPPQGSQCTRYLNLLKSLFPGSPVATCAEHGIESDSCLDAYDQQYISSESVSPESDSALSLDQKTKLEAGIAKNLPPAENLSALESAYNNEATQDNKVKLLGALQHEMLIQCENTYLRLVDTQPPPELQAGYVDVVRKNDRLAKMIEKFSNADKVETKTEKSTQKVTSAQDQDYKIFRKEDGTNRSEAPTKQLWRVRFLDKNCLDSISRALELDPSFYPAICIREGHYSPACILSKRATLANSAKSGSTKKSTRPTSGKEPLFQTF